MTRLGMVVDLKRCIGCHTCTLACKVENGTGPGIFWTRVYDREHGLFPNVQRRFLPVGCMHCADPSCAHVCSTGATYKRADGLVLIDQEKCNGCKRCVVACPYGVRSVPDKIEGYFPGFGLTPYEEWASKKHRAGVAEKCNFCSARLEEGKEPACVSSCITKARTFGDIDDGNSEIARLLNQRCSWQLRSKLGLGPAIFYLS